MGAQVGGSDDPAGFKKGQGDLLRALLGVQTPVCTIPPTAFHDFFLLIAVYRTMFPTMQLVPALYWRRDPEVKSPRMRIPSKRAP